jgi:hypothetical protein
MREPAAFVGVRPAGEGELDCFAALAMTGLGMFWRTGRSPAPGRTKRYGW